jgi:hypothetical protein
VILAGDPTGAQRSMLLQLALRSVYPNRSPAVLQQLLWGNKRRRPGSFAPLSRRSFSNYDPLNLIEVHLIAPVDVAASSASRHNSPSPLPFLLIIFTAFMRARMGARGQHSSVNTKPKVLI